MFFRHKRYKGAIDLMILGGGSAAFAAAIRAAELGANVAIAEGGIIGGTCVNRGCLPTKNLLYAAERYYLYNHNSFPGLPSGQELATFPEVIKQKDELVESNRQSKYWDILKFYPTIKYYPHNARFISPYEVQVGDEVVKTDKYIIATGASPAIIPIEGIQEMDYLTYKEALDLKILPSSLIIIGAGPIGLELGQMYSRFGSKVIILEALPRIAPTEDEEISGLLENYLKEEGIEIWTGIKVQSVRRKNGSVVVATNLNGKEVEFQGERLLLAAGLKPNTADLNLKVTGVEVDKKGAIKVDAGMRTSAKHIWAAGDVTGKLMLVTVAAHQGIIAAENALKGKRRKIDYSTIPHAIFTSPQVAGVGIKEKEAQERGMKVKSTIIPFSLVPKAGAMRDTRGMLKMVADASNYRILGVHMIGPEAADLILLGTLAVRYKLTVGDLIRTIFVYPTMAEAYKIAALSFKKDVTKLSCCAE